jgi:hypothetical protein
MPCRTSVAAGVHERGHLQQRRGTIGLRAERVLGTQPVADVDGEAGDERGTSRGVAERELVRQP